MLEAEVDANPDVGGFIFDGFPRTAAQAEALDVFLQGKNMSIRATIALEVDEEVLVSRLLSRGKIVGAAMIKMKIKFAIALLSITKQPL